MITLLCIPISKEKKEVKAARGIGIVVICCIFCFASWICYYIGITNLPVVMGLTIPPCLAFLFYAIYRKNIIALIPIIVFTLCHLIYAIMNFA